MLTRPKQRSLLGLCSLFKRTVSVICRSSISFGVLTKRTSVVPRHCHLKARGLSRGKALALLQQKLSGDLSRLLMWPSSSERSMRLLLESKILSPSRPI